MDITSGRLDGCVVLIIRPAGLGERLAQMGRDEGGCAVVFPAIEVLPATRPERLESVLDRLHTYDFCQSLAEDYRDRALGTLATTDIPSAARSSFTELALFVSQRDY